MPSEFPRIETFDNLNAFLFRATETLTCGWFRKSRFQRCPKRVKGLYKDWRAKPIAGQRKTLLVCSLRLLAGYHNRGKNRSKASKSALLRNS